MKGTRVEVYQDPLTRQKFEGTATLIECDISDGGIYDGKTLQQWRVRFDDEDEEFYRWILVDERNANA